MNKFLLLALCILFSIQANLVAESKNSGLLSEARKISFLLPINATASPKYNLVVSIPEGYHSLQSQEALVDPQVVGVEFVPIGENGDNWSEIITVNKYIGKRLYASQVIDYLKKHMLSIVENAKVLKFSTTKENSYEVGYFSLAYDLNGKHEVLVSRYYSGPYDCAGIQITIRPKNGQSDEQTVAKIENFLNQNTKVQAFDLQH